MTRSGQIPRRLTRGQADQLVSTVVEGLARRGVLPAGAGFDADAFHRLRARVRETFQVPETSVTPVMARLLYAIGAARAPRRLLVVGSYCGNTLVWLAGHALPAAGSGEARALDAVGCDPDPEACAVARGNFARLGAGGTVRVVAQDGHRVLATEPVRSWDLVLLDADDPVRRKAVYGSLLEAAGSLPPGCLLLAHDTSLPQFAADLRPYLDRVADRSRYATVHLPIDECGLSVSLVGRRERARDDE